MKLILVSYRIRMTLILLSVIFSSFIIIKLHMLNHLIILNYPTTKRYESLSVKFIDQVNEKSAKLHPGEGSKIEIIDSECDKLVLIGAYCKRSNLLQRFPEMQGAVINTLLEISEDDQIAPALIWLKNSRIISVNPVKFKVGADFELHVWNIRERRFIKFKKELNSKNNFLSIYFIND